MKTPTYPVARRSGPLRSIAPVVATADSHHSGRIQAESGNTAQAAFDIVHARITTDGLTATFHIAVSGAVGFNAGAGILALAVTAHPGFDDTPLF